MSSINARYREFERVAEKGVVRLHYYSKAAIRLTLRHGRESAQHLELIAICNIRRPRNLVLMRQKIEWPILTLNNSTKKLDVVDDGRLIQIEV